MNRRSKKTTKRGTGRKRAKAGKKPEPITPSTVEMESKPVINRRFKGPSSKTLSLILEGSAKIPSYDHRAVDHLARLVIDLQIFFGQERKDAAHFLFSVWTDAFRAPRDNPQPHAYPASPDALQPYDDRMSLADLQARLKQFRCDVKAEIEPKKKRGRPAKDIVTFARQRRQDEDKPTYRAICIEWYRKTERIDWWHSLTVAQQQRLINGLMSACGKKPQQGKNPEKL